MRRIVVIPINEHSKASCHHDCWHCKPPIMQLSWPASIRCKPTTFNLSAQMKHKNYTTMGLLEGRLIFPPPLFCNTQSLQRDELYAEVAELVVAVFPEVEEFVL